MTIHVGPDEVTPPRGTDMRDECLGCRALRKRIEKIESRFPDDIDAREMEGQIDEHERRIVDIEAAMADLRELKKGVQQVLSLNTTFALTLERANAVQMRATLVLDAINEREARWSAPHPGVAK